VCSIMLLCCVCKHGGSDEVGACVTCDPQAQSQRAILQLCLVCWEGQTHDKQLLLERTWLWWQQHRLLPLSRLPASDRCDICAAVRHACRADTGVPGCDTVPCGINILHCSHAPRVMEGRRGEGGGQTRTSLGNLTLRPHPTQALQWLESIHRHHLSSTRGPHLFATVIEGERAPRSLLSRAVSQWAMVALQRLKRQASMILRFCDTTSRLRDSRDSLPLAIAAHHSAHRPARTCAPLALPRSPAMQLGQSGSSLQMEERTAGTGTNMTRSMGARLMSPGSDLKQTQQLESSGLQALASPEVGALAADDLEELSFLSDFLASRGAAASAETPRSPAAHLREVESSLTLQQLQLLEAECSYLGDLVSEQDSFNSEQPRQETDNTVLAATRQTGVSSRHTAALSHSQALTDSPSTSVLTPRGGKMRGRESKMVQLAKAFMLPSPPHSYPPCSGAVDTSSAFAERSAANARQGIHKADAHEASEQQPRESLPAMQSYPSPPPTPPLSRSIHDSQEERDFQRWLLSVKASRG